MQSYSGASLSPAPRRAAPRLAAAMAVVASALLVAVAIVGYSSHTGQLRAVELSAAGNEYLVRDQFPLPHVSPFVPALRRAFSAGMPPKQVCCLRHIEEGCGTGYVPRVWGRMKRRGGGGTFFGGGRDMGLRGLRNPRWRVQYRFMCRNSRWRRGSRPGTCFCGAALAATRAAVSGGSPAEPARRPSRGFWATSAGREGNANPPQLTDGRKGGNALPADTSCL